MINCIKVAKNMLGISHYQMGRNGEELTRLSRENGKEFENYIISLENGQLVLTISSSSLSHFSSNDDSPKYPRNRLIKVFTNCFI